MNNAPAEHYTGRRMATARVCTAAIAALLALTVATVACGSSSGNSDGITRANISDLPTPTGGEIFTSADEVAATSITDEAPPEGTLFEGAEGFEGTIIEDVVAENPEIAALIQKVQSGEATDADFERLNTLMSEAFAPGGTADLLGFGAPPTVGSIVAVNGNAIDIQPETDAQGITGQRTTVTINDETQILVASEVALTDIEINSDVDVIAIRGEDGIIRGRTITIADIDDLTLGADADGAQAFGRRAPFARLLRGTGLAAPPGRRTQAGVVIQGSGPGQRQQGRAPGARFASRSGAGRQPAQDDAGPANGINQLFDDAEGIPAQGRVTKIEDARIHIETEQGPLRVTIDDQTEIVRIASGTASNIAEGLATFALADPDGNAIMMLVGPDSLISAQGTGFAAFGP